MTEGFSPENTLNEFIAGGLTPDEISFLTRAQYGGRLEMDRNHEAGEQWGAVNKLQTHLIDTDPQRAFDLGLALTTTQIPTDKQADKQAQIIRLWNLGTGLTLIADPRLKIQLITFLKSEIASNLLGVVQERFTSDIEVPDDISGLSDHPECYALAAAVLFALQIEDTTDDRLAQIKDLARNKITDPEFQKLLALYKTIPDTQEFAQTIQTLAQ